MNKLALGRRSFHSLSLRDLLEARDLYHVHLAHLENVVATAIGRKRFRKSEIDSHGNLKRKSESAARSPDNSEKRLDNTVSPDWGWPCVLVFVRDWWTPADFGHQPDQAVPPFLYLPDGRIVPTCVLRMVVEDQAVPPPTGSWNFPSDMFGGGYVAVSDVQGIQHAGSIGCLVTDGDSTYAITNRHVTGEAGRDIYSIISGSRQQLGVSDANQIGKVPFDHVYPGWPGTTALANLDAGLIRVDDVTKWTAQVFGIGEIGEPIDLGVDTLSLDLINLGVCAFGSASGKMNGQIVALFYRYKSIAGTDYISDLLIGGVNGAQLPTLPGDSGTIWFLKADAVEDAQSTADVTDSAEKKGKTKKSTTAVLPTRHRLSPLAMQWGGHSLLDSTGPDRKEFRYALATCLSTVCRLLDVDVVRDRNLGHFEYWGEMGHYGIGLKACGLVSQSKLKKLMKDNSGLIGFDDPTMRDPSRYKIHSAGYTFVPLADVADDVWRMTRMGSQGHNDDGNNHFADMDQPDSNGTTLLSLTRNHPEKVDPQIWSDFYASLSADGESTNAGALPFRVWQMYDEAVKALADDQDVVQWFCLMGTMAHYVGDACQPLHVSRFHHGIPPVHKGSWQYNVHSVYESTMLDQHATDIIDGLNTRLHGASVPDDGGRGGQQAAVLVVELMRSTVKTIDPEKLVKTYNDGTSPSNRIEALWDKYGEKTMDCMAQGAKTLAMLWERAWAEGNGAGCTQPDSISTGSLETLYRKTSFAPSMSLDLMIQSNLLIPQP